LIITIVASLTDTHCHLNLNTFQDDLPEVLDRAWACGLERILIPGIDLPTSRLAVDLADQHPRIYAAVGVHPSDALTWDSHSLASLESLARHPKVVAIGEIGLDYYRDHAPRDLQRSVFLQQLELAQSLGKPVSIHNRSTYQDLWEITARWHANLGASSLAAAPGVFHSFDGTLDEARSVAEKGFFLGISGPVTFTNARLRQELVRDLDLARLLVETDAPYLTPHPHRGKRNEPAFTHFIVKKIADLHQIEYDKVARVTSTNAARLFDWGAEI
jgi:TatD DNase family protein